MTKVYACLIGNWVCLNDDPNCTITKYHKTPYCWWKEGSPICSPNNIPDSEISKQSYESLDYVEIYYMGVKYRINPIFIQIIDT